MMSRVTKRAWMVLLLASTWALTSTHANSQTAQEPCADGLCQHGQGQMTDLSAKDPPAPQVVVRVRVPSCAVAGKELEYRILVENCGGGDAHHVVLKNPLPAGVRFVRASPAPHQKEPELQWHLGTMHGGAKCEISLVVVPTALEDIRNCTRIQYEHGQCVTTRIAALPPGAGGGPGQSGTFPPPPVLVPEFKGPPKIQEIPAEGLPKLSLKIEGPDKKYFTMPGRYVVTVTNLGKSPATNLLLRVNVPNKMVIEGASDKGIPNMTKTQVDWIFERLDTGGSRSFEILAKSSETGLRCVKAEVLADRDLTAKEEFCTTFVGIPGVHMEMSDTIDPIALGEQTSFPIVVENTGTAPLTNLRIRARLPMQMNLVKTEPINHQRGPLEAAGEWLEFEPRATLEPGAKASFEVFAKGQKPGDARIRLEMRADQLDRNGPVIEEISTQIYDQTAKVKGKLISRKKLTHFPD